MIYLFMIYDESCMVLEQASKSHFAPILHIYGFQMGHASDADHDNIYEKRKEERSGNRQRHLAMHVSRLQTRVLWQLQQKNQTFARCEPRESPPVHSVSHAEECVQHTTTRSE